MNVNCIHVGVCTYECSIHCRFAEPLATVRLDECCVIVRIKISEICVESQAAQTWKYFTQGLKERIVAFDLKGIGSHRVTQVHKWKKSGMTRNEYDTVLYARVQRRDSMAGYDIEDGALKGCQSKEHDMTT